MDTVEKWCILFNYEISTKCKTGSNIIFIKRIIFTKIVLNFEKNVL